MTTTKSKTKKIQHPKQDREVLALCVFGHGGSSMAWSIGFEPNIIHATKAARKAKRDNNLKGWQIMPVTIFDIHDCHNWACDGYRVVNPDIVDKESKSYKEGDIYDRYRGCPSLKKIETLEVVL
tara:strand:+ start:359 stop:730 length:372 start_codon:yes stop_codon:yes gene_type:complete